MHNYNMETYDMHWFGFLYEKYVLDPYFYCKLKTLRVSSVINFMFSLGYI